MMLSIIAAMDDNGGIGYQNRIPWHLGSDFKSFKAMTMGHHILMGRKTYDSLGKTLPGRIHVVISRAKHLPMPEKCFLVNSLNDGIILAESHGESEAFVIGGEQIFRQALPLANRMILTRVHTACIVDVYFPSICWEEWQITQSQGYAADEHNDYAFTIEDWIRKDSKVVN